MLDGLKAAHPLVLDGGNALFRAAGSATPEDKARAHFVLDVMGRLGTRAMAVGPQDLSAGLDFLRDEGRRAKVKLLSCNLKAKGATVFEPFAVLDAAGLKVAVVGVSPPGPIVLNHPEVMAEGTLDSVRATLAKLPPHQLTVVLAATSYADALQLAEQLSGQVDFVIQAGEFRGTRPPQKFKDTFLFVGGQKGQAVAKAVYEPGNGRGPIVDLTALEADRAQLQFVEGQVRTLQERLTATPDGGLRDQLVSSLQGLQARRQALAAAAEVKVPAGARTLAFSWTALTTEVADDPALKAEVLKIEPTYAGSH